MASSRDAPVTAVADPALAVAVTGERELFYGADRDAAWPPHVRAASGLAFVGGKLAVIQDDVAVVAAVGPEAITGTALPPGPDGRPWRSEKAHKLDLEACVVVDDELWVLGSGSLPTRERIAVVGTSARVVAAGPFYARVRAALGGAINLEAAAVLGDELWVFHRGNTGVGDRGPAVVRFDRAAVARWLHGIAGVPDVIGARRYALGTAGGAPLGFTDAVAIGGRVFYVAVAEAAPNAIDDGPITGAQLGVIAGDRVRTAPLAHAGAPLKAEGLAFDPRAPHKGWIAIDPDDPDRPARLYDVELLGAW